jgi:hypothetical protein
MWKSIVLCVSLFGGAALGLAVGARFVEAAALPAAAAIGLCVIGVVLILAAPTAETQAVDERQLLPAASTTKTDIEPAALGPAATVTNRTPAIPFEAINS